MFDKHEATIKEFESVLAVIQNCQFTGQYAGQIHRAQMFLTETVAHMRSDLAASIKQAEEVIADAQ